MKTMWKKTKSEWKTYDEMDSYEQTLFRIQEGWKSYASRIRSVDMFGRRTYEYRIDTWEIEDKHKK